MVHCVVLAVSSEIITRSSSTAEIRCVGGHYAVQGHSFSVTHLGNRYQSKAMHVSLHVSEVNNNYYILSRTVSKLSRSIDHVFGLHGDIYFNGLFLGISIVNITTSHIFPMAVRTACTVRWPAGQLKLKLVPRL